MNAMSNNLQTATPVWIEITVIIMIVAGVSSDNKNIKNFLVGKEHLLQTHILNVASKDQ
jgi:uncharacterized ion transporter superfamily protein YfcC